MSRHLAHSYSVAEYEGDINQFMKHQEEQRYRLHFSAPQLKFREELLMKIITVVNKLRLSERTLHIAVNILDTYMDCHDINIKRLELVSFACISVAAKYEENDEKTSRLTELLQLMKEQPRKGVLIKMEFMLLKFMQWKFIPTAVHFAEYYVQYAISPDDVNHVYVSGEELILAVRQYMKMFLRLALLDKRLMNEPRSLIASACIAAARDKLCLFPIWPNQMVQLTGYRHYQVCAYVQLLLVNIGKQSGNYGGDQEKNIICRCPCCSCYCCTSGCINTQPASSSYMPLQAPQSAPSFSLTIAIRDNSQMPVCVNDQGASLNLT